MNKRLVYLYLATIGTILMVGCTLAEWKAVGADALADAPDAAIKLVTDPSPINLIVTLAAFVSGLVGKSAARGFGRGVSKTSTIVGGVIQRLKAPKPPSE